MRKFKVIFSIRDQVYEETVEATHYTCPGPVKFYFFERVVGTFSNVAGVMQIEGPLQTTDKEKELENMYKEKRNKNKQSDEEEDPFAAFK